MAGLRRTVSVRGRGMALALVEAIEARRFSKDGITASQLRQLRGLDDAEIRAALDRVYGKVNDSPAGAKATMARLRGSGGRRRSGRSTTTASGRCSPRPAPTATCTATSAASSGRT